MKVEHGIHTMYFWVGGEKKTMFANIARTQCLDYHSLSAVIEIHSEAGKFWKSVSCGCLHPWFANFSFILRIEKTLKHPLNFNFLARCQDTHCSKTIRKGEGEMFPIQKVINREMTRWPLVNSWNLKYKFKNSNFISSLPDWL